MVVAESGGKWPTVQQVLCGSCVLCVCVFVVVCVVVLCRERERGGRLVWLVRVTAVLPRW